MKLNRARFFWVYPLAVWLFLTARTTELSLRLGLVFIILGEAIRLWSNAYVGHVKVNWTQKERGDPKEGHLVTAGPYAYVRNPLYVGSFVIGAGLCLAVRNPLLAVGALGFFVWSYRRKVLGEEAVILDEWGQEYEAYRRGVPRWIPTLRPYPAASRYGQASWQGIVASKEFKTAIWVSVCVIALYFREEFLIERELFAGKNFTRHLVLAVVMAGLMATDIIFELVKRSKRAPARLS